MTVRLIVGRQHLASAGGELQGKVGIRRQRSRSRQTGDAVYVRGRPQCPRAQVPLARVDAYAAQVVVPRSGLLVDR